jgi:cytoskeletal protein CcmA (bactofilin family)
MFSKKEEIDTTKIDTIIGKETVINGTVEAKGILRIEGKITGKLNTSSDIIIAPTGLVEAEIKCRSISIAGSVHGNVDSKGVLEIEPTGKLFGDITVAKLSIGDGAVFHGNCQMQGQNQPVPSKAKPEK